MVSIMMKVLGSLFRLLCSLLVLVSAALYVQAPANPDVDTFVGLISAENVTALFTSVNWVSITAAVLVVAAVLRLLPIVWNMAFCASLILVTHFALYLVFGAGVALPESLQNNEAVAEFCNLPQTYQVPALLVALVFALGWLASNAAFRIAFCTLLCYGLWYLCAVLFHMCVGMWAEKPLLDGGQEIVTFLQEHTWVSAALPGVFFLVYTLLMSFFDSFPTSAPMKKEADETAEEPAEKTDMKPAADPTKKAVTAPLGKPTPTRPIGVAKPTVTRPIGKPKPAALKKPATTAAPAAAPVKTEAPAVPAKPVEPTKPEAPAAPAPKAEETPKAEEAPKPEVKAEAKPTETADKPATEAAKAEEKSEPKPADTPEVPAAPAAESKPETPAADKPTETPAEKPADTTKAE